jgi:hypothetical protein
MDFMRIFKYVVPLTGKVILLAPGWKILSVKDQGNEIVIYLLVDSVTEPTESIEVVVVPTGVALSMPSLENMTFIDTVSQCNGTFMWHVFYKR